jgi:hypothetical protein
MTNLDRKARCCAADLKFLLSLLPEDSDRRVEVSFLIVQMRKDPTNEQINAAWKIAAIIHEELRTK